MNARVLPPTPANLRRMAAHLRRGGLVAVPTETVYGLAANALNPRACRAIFRAKRRPAHDPLIVHVADLAAAEALAEWNDAARAVARRFWPGPLTLVLPKRSIVPAVVTSSGSSVAIRCPAHPVMRRLLRLAGVPLAAPSANPFGYVSPTTAAHVMDSLGDRIPFVLDGGSCRVGLESTILDLRAPRQPRILRPGAINARELTTVLGRRVKAPRAGRAASQPIAPGMLARHYSPRTPLTLVPESELTKKLPRLREGEIAVFFRRPSRLPQALRGQVRWFSTTGVASEAAQHLYKVLRELDHERARRAFVAGAPRSAGPWGKAINDRLARAARRG